MALQGAYIQRSPVASLDTSQEKGVRDALLRGCPNDGMRHIFDLAFSYCYPAGLPATRPAPGAPADGAVVRDVAERANSAVRVAGGQAVGYAGGGFDFSGITAKGGGYIEVPPSVAADFATPYGGVVQRFLVCLYVRLPTLADGNVSGSMASIIGSGASNYQASPEIFCMGMLAANGGTLPLTYRRQTALNIVDRFDFLNPAVSDLGNVVQLAFWRNAFGQNFRLKSPNGTRFGVPGTNTGADNPLAIGTNPIQIGVGQAGFWQSNLVTAGQDKAVRFRVYRAFFENLARSGRDPAAVLDADYDRVMARGVFS